MESGSLSAKEAGRNKIIVILGPTSSGKSDIAIRLAKKFDGEIISADSRQIYKGLDIGTGKISQDRTRPLPPTPSPSGKSLPAGRQGWGEGRNKIYYSKKIHHYLINIASPKQEYNVSHFKKDAEKIIKDILKRGKLPIICGGTGFWIQAVVDNVNFPNVKPDRNLRKKLDKYSATKLFSMLKKLDPERAKTIDAKNKVRLIRAIEICKAIGKVPLLHSPSPSGKSLPAGRQGQGEGEKSYEFLQLGIDIPKEKLYENIKKRLKKRFKQGVIEEVEKLKNPPDGGGLSWKKIQSFGLGYYWIPLYLQKKLDKKELFEKIYQAEKNYAKRQFTWFRKDKRIRWVKSYGEIEKIVAKNS